MSYTFPVFLKDLKSAFTDCYNHRTKEASQKFNKIDQELSTLAALKIIRYVKEHPYIQEKYPNAYGTMRTKGSHVAKISNIDYVWTLKMATICASIDAAKWARSNPKKAAAVGLATLGFTAITSAGTFLTTSILGGMGCALYKTLD